MDLFSLKGKNAVVLGGAGILGAAMAQGLADAGASIAIGDRFPEHAIALAEKLTCQGCKTDGFELDAMSPESLTKGCERIMNEFGSIDILVNAVGGNRPDATCTDTVDFFGLSMPAVESVVSLNLFAGAILPSQIFGKTMAEQKNDASIINISSMNSFRPLTKIVGYSAAKAAVNNFTQWLAVHVAQSGYTSLRVNAIAPGFFMTTQNEFLLKEEKTGNLTERGQKIIDHTPMGRFGEPTDLVGALVWLASDASKFVTGIVVPVDGGFSAYSGV